MITLQTTHFGTLTLPEEEVITFSEGLLGFPELKRFCIVDPSDDVLILWLQSIDKPSVVFPILEPTIFKKDYIVKLSGMELRALKLSRVSSAAVYNILTIEADATQMTANLKAPLVIHLAEKIGRQVVLQENEYTVKFPMFATLKQHLITLKSNASRLTDSGPKVSKISDLSPTTVIKSLIDLH